MAGFSKLFASIITSSLWAEDDKTRILWITMLATCDQYGVVDGSVPGLAHIARITTDECRTSLERLLSPDPESRTKTAEGRRIEVVDGGWKIINYTKYREKGRHVDRAEYLAMKNREYRARKKKSNRVYPMTKNDQPQPNADADTRVILSETEQRMIHRADYRIGGRDKPK